MLSFRLNRFTVIFSYFLRRYSEIEVDGAEFLIDFESTKSFIKVVEKPRTVFVHHYLKEITQGSHSLQFQSLQLVIEESFKVIIGNSFLCQSKPEIFRARQFQISHIFQFLGVFSKCNKSTYLENPKIYC